MLSVNPAPQQAQQQASGSLMERQERFSSIKETFHCAGFRSEDQINMVDRETSKGNHNWV
ncbi:hypothetical protein A2U01_0097501, partial [Trifolium medium]|nr:hypothetical protein [Trifolium medium]